MADQTNTAEAVERPARGLRPGRMSHDQIVASWDRLIEAHRRYFREWERAAARVLTEGVKHG